MTLAEQEINRAELRSSCGRHVNIESWKCVLVFFTLDSLAMRGDIMVIR